MAEMKDTSTLSARAAEALAQFRLARFDSSRELVYCDAGEFPLGPVFALTANDDMASVGLLLNKNGTAKCIAAGTITAGNAVYTAADGKVGETNAGVLVGEALNSASANEVVEVLPDLRRVPTVNVAASSVAGATSTSQVAFDVSRTIPVIELKAGSIFRVRAAGIVVDQDTTPQCDVRLLVGTEVIATATVAAAADNDQFDIAADIVLRSIGATAAIVAACRTSFDAAGQAVITQSKASATEDLTSGAAITVTVQFNASHADNQARLDILEIEHVR